MQQLYYVTGEADMVVILTVADMAEYQQLTRQLFFAEGNVKSFRTMVALESSKVSFAIGVERRVAPQFCFDLRGYRDGGRRDRRREAQSSGKYSPVIDDASALL